jgi:hypothetical protein
MNLIQKLITVYEDIDHVEKAGINKNQSYRYVRAADMVRAVRKALLRLDVYAELNFTNERQYTIAREKAPNAPFSAVDVRCTIVFRDGESGETLTSSGLGTGADTGDKAIYKAQTGATKYALRNAFLVPDEADPEADPALDESADPSTSVDNMPDFHEAQHTAPRANTPKETPAAAPAPAPAKTIAPKKKTEPVGPPKAEIPAQAPAQPKPEAAPEPAADGEMPTEEQMTGYRQAFKRLGDDLSTEGKLKSSAKLPVERKLLVFLLSITGATDAKKITRAQWDNFFSRATTVAGPADARVPEGLIGLAKLVNKANGIEEKK